MAQDVRGEAVAQPHEVAVLAHDAPCTLTRQSAAPRVEEHRVCVVAAPDTLRGELLPASGREPCSERIRRQPTERYDAFLASLAEDPQQARVHVDVTK